MKVYRGNATPPEGFPAVTVDLVGDGAVQMPLQPELQAEGFEWGKKGLTLGEKRLAFALLLDATGDKDLALRYHQRLKHRITPSMKTTWSMTDAEILAHVQSMKDIERESTPMVRQVAQEPAPVVNEGGQGIGWSKQGTAR